MKKYWPLLNVVCIVSILITATFAPQSVEANEADVLFDDSVVHEIRIDFTDTDWYNTLYDSHANDPDDPYFPATFEYDGESLDLVGVRFKGNSSFGIGTQKKSFKIDFNEYIDDTTFFGLKKLNLNNGFKDPTMLREKLFLDFAAKFVPAVRSAYARVYVNGTPWGLYTVVEQVDKTFAESRFGGSEDGNLFKGAASDDADGPQSDFGSDLTWLGSDPLAYYDHYQLKTNEDQNDYSQLIDFIDVLNNQSPTDFPALLEPIFDVPNALSALALNNLFVNLDSYLAVAHNYYLYDRDDTGRITHIHWDTNEAFGRFLMGVAMFEDPLELDPFWLPSAVGPPPAVAEERPLMENLWANTGYSNSYLCNLQQMLDSGFDADTMQARINQLADLIRTDVYADSNKMYSNDYFEQNLTSDIADGMSTIYGLLNFVTQRAVYMNARLAALSLQCPSTQSDLSGTLFINEFMADNDTTIQDPDGSGYPDWIELHNTGPLTLELGGLYLSDDLSDPTQWQIPQGVSIGAGGYLLVWADNDEPQGDTHANFKLSASGEEIGLFENDGIGVIDSIVFGEQAADVSQGRCPDGTDSWQSMDQPTPGTGNVCAEGAVHQGLWADRGRNGTGIDLRAVDTSAPAESDDLIYFLTFFSYANDNTPEWLNSTGRIADNNYTSDAVIRAIYDFDAGDLDSDLTADVGSIDIEFDVTATHPACVDGVDRSDAVELAAMSWVIDGESDSWCIEPLLSEPVTGVNFDGHWYAGPDDNGWGFTLEVEGSNVAITLYYYDAAGNPRWAQGVTTFDSTHMEISMFDYIGFCRLCTPTDVQSTSLLVGTISLDLGTPTQSLEGGNTVSVDITYAGTEGGNWSRSAVPVQLISSPQ